MLSFRISLASFVVTLLSRSTSAATRCTRFRFSSPMAALSASRDFAKSHSVAQTREYVEARINAIEGLEVEYYSIVDADSLADVTNWNDAASVVGCITVYCGSKPIRLIDHIHY